MIYLADKNTCGRKEAKQMGYWDSIFNSYSQANWDRPSG